MSKHLTNGEKMEICAYYQAHMPMADIAEIYGITRQGIYKILKTYGIDTRKRKVEVFCFQCGAIVRKHKSTVRRHAKQFCNQACYIAWMQKREYIQNRQGCRKARKIVAEHFDLQAEHIVHHEDGDNTNNDLSNLAVFVSHAEHISYHRGGEGKPIWKGRDLPL